MRDDRLCYSLFRTALLYAVIYGASCANTLAPAAPAPLVRKATKDTSHPDWATGRWEVGWDTTPWHYELFADGRCVANLTDHPVCYVGTWTVCNDVLTIREQHVNGSNVGSFSAPLCGEAVVVRDGKYHGTRISLKRPKVTD